MNITIRQVQGGSGIDVWAENLCRGIGERGHECFLDLQPALYQFFPFMGKFLKFPGNTDILHGNTWNGFAFKNKIPLVVTEHLVVHDPAYDSYRTNTQKLYHRWIRRCEEKSLDAADAVVCVSADTCKVLFREFGYSGARLIYNGIDESVFRPREIARNTWHLPENKTILLFTGNLSRRKGADLLPGIMEDLGKDYLLLTTTGKRNRSQSSIPHSWDLGHLTREQLVDAYNLCDLFITPSRLEGLSLSTLEAMACARPVIAFNCSSFPELVVDGKGGFLPEKDNVREFSDRIISLAGDPETARQMGLFNRERILERFTLGSMAGEYIRLYSSVLDRAS